MNTSNQFLRCAVIAVNCIINSGRKTINPVMNYFTEIATWIFKRTLIAYHCIPLCVPCAPWNFKVGEHLWPEIRGGGTAFPRVLLHFNHWQYFSNTNWHCCCCYSERGIAYKTQGLTHYISIFSFHISTTTEGLYISTVPSKHYVVVWACFFMPQWTITVVFLRQLYKFFA